MIEVIITREEMDRAVGLSSRSTPQVPLSRRAADYASGRLHDAGVPMRLTVGEALQVTRGELCSFDRPKDRSIVFQWRDDNESN